MQRIEISVIIPTFNEAKNIVSLLKKLQQQLEGYSYEIIIIDDHSPDGTYSEVKRKVKSKFIKTYLHQGSPELGHSILQGVLKAKGEFIIGMDADFNHDPRVIPLLIVASQYYDMVVASRFIVGGGMSDQYRFITSWLFNLILKIFFRFPVSDNTSGFYIIKRKLLQNLSPSTIYKGYGEYHLRLVYLAKKNNYKLAEVPVFYGKRTYGESKSRFFSMLITYLYTALKLNLS